MKHIKLLLTACCLLFIFLSINAMAETVEYDFEDGTTQGFSVIDGAGSVSNVDLAAEGIDAQGKGLKISSAAENRNITNAGVTLTAPVAGNQTYSIEAKIRQSAPLNTKKILILSSAAGRSKPNGLFQFYRAGTPAFNSIIANGVNSSPVYDDKFNGVGTNTHYIVKTDRWYKINIVYTMSDIPGEEKIQKLIVTDLNDNTIVINETYLAAPNNAYPLSDITKINFSLQSWGTAESLYIDYIKIAPVFQYNSARLMKGFQAIENLENGSLDVEIDMTSGMDGQSVAIIGVLIEKENGVLNVKQMSGNLFCALSEGSNTKGLSFEIPEGVDLKNYELQVMIWSKLNGTPLCEPILFTGK